MLSLKCVMERYIKTGEVVFNLTYFHSGTEVNLEGTNVNDLCQKMTNKILEGIAKYNKGGSNFIFKQILSLEIHTVQYEPLGGSSYIPLLPEVANKKAVINLINKEDSKCFMWSVTRARHPAKDHSEHIDPKLKKATENFNWDGITFPVDLKQTDRFEKQNPTISVNVFGYEKKKVTILRKSETYKRENIVDLLLISKGEVQHYCLIKNLSRFISSYNKHQKKKYVCRGCLNTFNFEDSLEKHIKYCYSKKACND